VFRQIQFVVPYVRRYRGILIQGIISLFLASLFSAAIPFFIKLAVDGLARGFSARVVRIIVITGFLALAQAGLKYLARTKILNSARAIEFEIRRDFFTHLASLPYSFFGSHHRGDLIARMMTDIGNIRMMIGMVTLHFSSTIATTVLSLVMMFTLSPFIAALSVVPLCFLLLAMKGFMGRLHHIFADIQNINGSLSRSMNEVLSGIRVIKNFLLQESERKRFENLNTDYLKTNMAATRLWGLLFPLIGFLGGLGTLLVMWVGGYYLMEHRITLGDFIALNTYYMMLMWPIAALGWILNLYQRGVASVRRVEEICQHEEERAGGTDPAPVKGHITFDRVTVVKDGRTILKDVTFALEAREKLLVVGPTGSGKSTLLSLILGFDQEYSGTILVDGRDIRQLSLSALRKAIAIVPQEPFLYSMSIAENVAPPDRDGPTRYEQDPVNEHPGVGLGNLIDMVNMREEIERFEAGINTVVGERGIVLSGGEKQRLTFARALAVEPRVLLLDDPLTHVDGYTEHLIWQRVSSLFENLTVLVVSSRPVPLSNIDKALVLANGSVADQGSPDDLLARNPYLRLLYEVKG
jgi:ATP-binding cassette, subfamily B, multidrug efflux pump